MLKLVRNTPEPNSDDGNDAHEVLHTSELILCWTDRDDDGTSAGAKCDEEEEPNDDNRCNTHGGGDEEPLKPVW